MYMYVILYVYNVICVCVYYTSILGPMYFLLVVIVI